jgi:hypothetical protein
MDKQPQVVGQDLIRTHFGILTALLTGCSPLHSAHCITQAGKKMQQLAAQSPIRRPRQS